MKIGELRKRLSIYDDDTEILIRNQSKDEVLLINQIFHAFGGEKCVIFNCNSLQDSLVIDFLKKIKRINIKQLDKIYNKEEQIEYQLNCIYAHTDDCPLYTGYRNICPNTNSKKCACGEENFWL